MPCTNDKKKTFLILQFDVQILQFIFFMLVVTTVYFPQCFVRYLSLSMAPSGAGVYLKEPRLRNLDPCIFRFLRFMFQCWTSKKSGDNDCKNRRTFTSPYYIYQQ